MYPLVPVLGLAALRRDANVRIYGIALAGIGALISSYHVVLERYPSLESGVCDPDNPCTLIWIRRFGYLTIPTMALSAFAVIVVLLLIAGRDATSDDETDDAPVTADTRVPVGV
jgi:disulfide bond formation protein DsbB